MKTKATPVVLSEVVAPQFKTIPSIDEYVDHHRSLSAADSGSRGE